MGAEAINGTRYLTGHALRNANLCKRSLARAEIAPPLARRIVQIRADLLGMTRLEFARRSGISRGTMRDLELGVHRPTRRTLQQFVAFCERSRIESGILEELRQLYAGRIDSLEQLLARMELLAGSPRKLAQRVGISPATLWEYRRGNFPIPLPLLVQMCAVVGTDVKAAEELWFVRERRRLLDRGFPEALAEFWTMCSRAGYAERHLFRLGLSTATARKLRYLELPPWTAVARAAQVICRTAEETQRLQKLWGQCEAVQAQRRRSNFGQRLHRLRKQQGISRRQIADLFGIGGKKPARIIKYIEEDGFYSAQAYPAGLAAVLSSDAAEQERLLDLWRERRTQFHRRHRPETRIDLRLTRELYGFEFKDSQTILGYTGLEYQKIERGVTPLLDTARARILEAFHQAGRQRIQSLLLKRLATAQEQEAWRCPATVRDLIGLLARREGGIIPLMRLLKKAGLKGLWAGRLRGIAAGKEVPSWCLLDQIGRACNVPDLTQAHLDWQDRYRQFVQPRRVSPLGIEVRLLIAEVASTLREFSPRLGFNYSVLIRDLQRLDRDAPIRWYHVERILRAVGLSSEEDRWREIRGLWSTADERRKKPPLVRPRPAAPATVAAE